METRTRRFMGRYLRSMIDCNSYRPRRSCQIPRFDFDTRREVEVSDSGRCPMNRILLTLACIACLSIGAFSQGLTTDDWYRLNRVSDVQFAPDGKSIAYVVTRADRETQKNVARIWVVASDGRSDPRLFISGFTTESRPRWSADSRRIAFVGTRAENERPQIYVAQ